MRIPWFLLVALAMLAFAGNSLLCRLAFQSTHIDPATFTTVRLACGALTLALLLRARVPLGGGLRRAISGAALFVYAAAFSFAYRSLTAATGALLLFGAVQVTMLASGFHAGERVRAAQVIGFVLAAGGLVALLLPGLSAPAPGSAALMLLAGIAWGIYSLRGKRETSIVGATAANFWYAVPIAGVLSVWLWPQSSFDARGLALAAASGSLTSALGYVLWYRLLPSLRTAQAASVQLSVPVITALGGVMLLGEALTVRLVVCGAVILGGIAMTLAPASSAD